MTTPLGDSSTRKLPASAVLSSSTVWPGATAATLEPAAPAGCVSGSGPAGGVNGPVYTAAPATMRMLATAPTSCGLLFQGWYPSHTVPAGKL